MPQQSKAPAVCGHRAGPIDAIVGQNDIASNKPQAKTQGGRSAQCNTPDHAAFAAKHYAKLINLLHALGVHWGPDPRRTHLAVCQMREQLAQEVCARDSATKREIIQEIRTRLCG
jgi:hypothetical protein